MTNHEARKARGAKRGLRTRRHEALTAEEQRRRDVQKDINRQLRGWTPRRLASWTLLVLGGVIAVQHWFAHMGVQPLPISMGWQDLLIGYPMAALVFIVGLFVLEPRPK